MKFHIYLLCLISVASLSFNYAEAFDNNSFDYPPPNYVEDKSATASTKLSYGSPLGAFDNIVNLSNNGGSRIYDFFGWEYECVEYVNRFYYEVFDYPPWNGTGNVSNYFAKLPQKYNDITAYNNKGSISPAPGDIMVWRASTSNQYHGHVAIVRDVQNNSVTVIQQNVKQNNEDAYYVLPMTIQNGIYNVTSDIGTVLGWLRTSREPNLLLIIDDEKDLNNFVGGDYGEYGWGGTDPNPTIYKKTKWKGYLNGFHYARTLPEYTFDTTKFAQGTWWIWPLYKSSYYSSRVDVFAFIPLTLLPKSKKVSYTMCTFDTNYFNQYCDSIIIDQSATTDKWKSLFQDIELPEGWGLWVSINNVTGEPSKYVVYDAIKIVSYPW
jgi:hypothetical protein